jgi:hypothetical protein
MVVRKGFDYDADNGWFVTLSLIYVQNLAAAGKANNPRYCTCAPMVFFER